MRRAGGRVVVDLQPELSPQNRTESLDVGLETGVHARSDPQSHPARRSNAGCAEEQGQLDDWYRRAADQSDSLDERWASGTDSTAKGRIVSTTWPRGSATRLVPWRQTSHRAAARAPSADGPVAGGVPSSTTRHCP
jgi:hypothetical protein